MSEFKGTKGKWSVKGRINLYVKSTIGILDYPICDISNFDKPLSESKANALLISKAPEMLQMLEEFVNNYENDNIDNFIMANSVDKAKGLIKSATEI